MRDRSTERTVAMGDAGSSFRRRLAVGIGVVLVLAAAALGVLRSSLFAADRLVVDGARRLSPERVLQIAGITRGENVVWFDAGEARRRLEADPWIAEAAVRSDLPDTIAVRISERVAVGAVQTHAGWQVLAADGVVLATPAGDPNLPAIDAVVPGEDAATIGAGLLGAMDADLRGRVMSLSLGTDGLVQLVLRGGVTVTYGTPGEARAKAQALAAVLDWAEDERAHVRDIDVSLPGAPTARLAGGAVAAP